MGAFLTRMAGKGDEQDYLDPWEFSVSGEAGKSMLMWRAQVSSGTVSTALGSRSRKQMVLCVRTHVANTSVTAELTSPHDTVFSVLFLLRQNIESLLETDGDEGCRTVRMFLMSQDT